MSFNLKNRPKEHDNPDWPKEINCYDNMEKWFEGFEEKQRQIIIHFYRWFNENWPKIKRRFNLHSVSGLTPKDLLTFFIEKEVLGEL